ncbi:MAG: alcohol dehydrogenase catalytic domain-containing protein [Planctomycetes bacterium]|nr:alcohol dehydrogenase catalytic domain-containing protein [Planctomycetota bacterium]
MEGTMRSWVLYRPRDMRLEERPIPAIAVDELLVKTRAVGICGSDVSCYYGNLPFGTADGEGPLVLGHEISGEVVEVGAAGKNFFAPGDRVAINPVHGCNACPSCMDGRTNLCKNGYTLGVSADGGFAEYVKVRVSNALKIGPGVDYAAAALAEPLACASYAMRRLDVRLGDRVVIIGAGCIGLIMTQLAKARGAGWITIIGTRDLPLELGLELGADCAINIRDNKSPNYAYDPKLAMIDAAGGLADRVVIPTADIEALKQGLELCAPGGTIVFFGLPRPGQTIEIPVLDAIAADLTIKFAWLSPLVWPEAMAALDFNRVDLAGLLSHRYTLEEAEKGIREMAAGRHDKVKAVLLMPD